MAMFAIEKVPFATSSQFLIHSCSTSVKRLGLNRTITVVPKEFV